jgi:hypothetical protein
MVQPDYIKSIAEFVKEVVMDYWQLISLNLPGGREQISR